MKGPQRDPRARLVDALNGAQKHGVTERHEKSIAGLNGAILKVRLSAATAQGPSARSHESPSFAR